jgi:hypothetical protein
LIIKILTINVCGHKVSSVALFHNIERERERERERDRQTDRQTDREGYVLARYKRDRVRERQISIV